MKQFSLILTFLINLTVFSQNYGKAVYSIKLSNDWHSFNAKLIFNTQKSIFQWKQRNRSKWVITKSYNNTGYTQKVFTDTLGHIVLSNLKSKNLIVRDFCKENTDYQYQDNINLKWKLKNEIKTIGSLKCKQATTNFRGRKYTAWYATEIPTSAGPWKFNGLPGLIVSIQDNKNTVSISLKNLKMLKGKMPSITISSSEISQQEFVECLDEEWKKGIKKSEAIDAQLRAEFPNVEITTETPKSRPRTELKIK